MFWWFEALCQSAGYSTYFDTALLSPTRTTQIAASAWQRAQEALNRPGRSCRHRHRSARPTDCTCAIASISVSGAAPIPRDRGCRSIVLPAAKFFRSGRHPEHRCSPIEDWAHEVPLPAAKVSRARDQGAFSDERFRYINSQNRRYGC
jgi:hypothetical protein